MLWPNTFIVGAMKAGTTTVVSALSKHPKVFMPVIKEPNFFCTDLYQHGLGRGTDSSEKEIQRVIRVIESGQATHHAYIQDEKIYLSLFKNSETAQISVDASTTYLYSEQAAKNIASKKPDAKIIICLRNPIERAISEFRMNVAIGTAHPPLRKMVRLEEAALDGGVISPLHRYVTAGLYHQQVRRYLEIFGRSNVVIIRFEDIHYHLQSTLDRVFSFLGVEQIKFGGNIHENSAISPRFRAFNYALENIGLKQFIRRAFPVKAKEVFKRLYYRRGAHDLKVDPEDLWMLREKFAADIANLSKLLDEDFSEWLHVKQPKSEG